MSFSNGEKLILMMLADIMKANKTPSEIDPEFVQHAINSDQTWALAWKYSSLTSNNPSVVDETCDILNMYRILKNNFDALPKDQQVSALKNARPFENYIEYQGFDFNNDTHASVVDMLVKHMDLYDEIDADLNSHSIATIDHYRQMLAKYKAIINTHGYQNWTHQQISDVLKG